MSKIQQGGWYINDTSSENSGLHGTGSLFTLSMGVLMRKPRPLYTVTVATEGPNVPFPPAVWKPEEVTVKKSPSMGQGGRGRGGLSQCSARSSPLQRWMVTPTSGSPPSINTHMVSSLPLSFKTFNMSRQLSLPIWLLLC